MILALVNQIGFSIRQRPGKNQRIIPPHRLPPRRGGIMQNNRNEKTQVGKLEILTEFSYNITIYVYGCVWRETEQEGEGETCAQTEHGFGD